MQDLEAWVREIADVLSIQNLSSDYCSFLDARDFVSLSELFAPDGVWIGQTNYDGVNDYTAVAVGPADVAEQLSIRIAPNPAAPSATTFHVTNPPRVQVSEDLATGRANWWQVQRDIADVPDITLFGYYEDEYGRIDGVWRFIRRESIIAVPAVANRVPSGRTSAEGRA